MKVCFISHSSAKGGAERALIELVDALRERGIEVRVILPSYGPLIEELKSRQITYQVFPYKWWMSKNSPIWKRIGRTVLNLSSIIPLAVMLKCWKCDVVYTNTITVCVGAFAAKLLRLPHVWHIHEFGYEDHGLVFDFGPRVSLWLMDWLSTVCIANSFAVAQKYQQIFKPPKLRVIYQSVSIPSDVLAEKIAVAWNAEIKCVIVGTLQEGKRQEDAIRAIGELVRQGIKPHLFIVGGGDQKYTQYLKDLVIQEGLGDYITFTGYVENPFIFMQNADVVLMCSRSEAFGRVTVEAMIMGKPVIGAKSGATPELICEGFNGLLYTLGDYKDLARKILYLYEHPELAKQMGENGRQWATRWFTRDRYVEEVLSILQYCVRQYKRKGRFPGNAPRNRPADTA